MAAIEDIQGTIEEISNISLDDIQSRHRRERKELQAKIQALKKDAPKSDKKKRKETLEKIKQLEMQLIQCQADEIRAAQAQTTTEQTNCVSKVDDTASSPVANNSSLTVQQEILKQRISKAQKRRDKKAQEARERDEKYKAAADIEIAFDPKTIEAQKLQQKLMQLKLTLYFVPPDGDCLYNAIRHQLIEKGVVSKTVQELRSDTANYIRDNKDTLIPYMTNPDTGDLLTDTEFEKYCEDVRSTSTWGGQIELKAMSSLLKVPIEILQADGSPTIQGDEYQSPPLVITYHRYMYSSGEHYNSTVPFIEKLNECNYE